MLPPSLCPVSVERECTASLTSQGRISKRPTNRRVSARKWCAWGSQDQNRATTRRELGGPTSSSTATPAAQPAGCGGRAVEWPAPGHGFRLCGGLPCGWVDRHVRRAWPGFGWPRVEGSRSICSSPGALGCSTRVSSVLRVGPRFQSRGRWAWLSIGNCFAAEASPGRGRFPWACAGLAQ